MTTKKSSTKRSLLMSVLSLFLCVAMLAGTTFAWFTDSVASKNNVIVAGNLDIELEYKTVRDGVLSDKWETVSDRDDIFDPNAYWEPGRTEVVYLKVSNLGSLALKYQLGVNVVKDNPGTNVADEEFYLSDHLVFKTVILDKEPTTAYTRDEAAVAAGNEMGFKDYNGKTTALEVDGEDYVALIVYMPETVGNEANHKASEDSLNPAKYAASIEFGINVFATQYTAEDDSFGNDYDEDAWHDAFKIYAADDLQAAINNGEDKIILMNDIELTKAINVPEGATVALNLDGKTITGTKGRDADNNRIHVIVNNGILTIKDGTVKSAGNDGGSAIYNNAGATLTIEDVTLYGAPQSDPVYEAGVSKPFPSYAVNNYGNAVVNGATVKSYHGAIATGGDGVTVINDADIDVGLGQSTGITSYLIYSYENAQVTVNDGKFAFTKQEIYVNGGNTFCELGTNPIIINGGNYTGTSFSIGEGREYVIKGGTFDKNPSNQNGKNYVANGYTAINNGNGTYTVVDQQQGGLTLSLVAGYPGFYTDGATGYYVYDAQGLLSMNKFFIDNPYANSNWGKTYNIMSDINAVGYTWKSAYIITGDNNNDGIVIDGHGNTITGLTINGGYMFSGTPCGGNDGVAPGVVKNLTMDGVVLNSNDWFTGIFWGNVSSDLVMDNVHVVNSTVSGINNVGALVASTGEFNGSVNITFKDCSVKNTAITARGANGQDPTGASAFIGRAFAETALVFEGENVVENNTFVNENGLVGGGIYAYTTWENGGFAGTGVCNSFTNWKEVEKVTVSTAEELKEAFKATVSDTTAVINIAADIQLAAGETWIPLSIDPYMSGTVNKVIVNGNGHTISGLNAPLFGDVHFGGTVVEIYDLTLSNSRIIGQEYNSGLGAFVSYADSCDSVTLKNCHLIDSYVEATKNFTGIGGLVGFSSSPLTIENCSVIRTTVIGANQSAGAIAGHVYGASITNVKVQDCTIKGERTDKTGYVVGTVNLGGSVITTTDCSNNTVFDVANSGTIYGRFVPNGSGTLTVNGVIKE